MAEIKITPLSDRMLDVFKEKNQELAVYLANGIKLSGRIIEYDKDTLILTSSTGPEGVTISRSSIATMTRSTDETLGRRPSEGAKPNTATLRRPPALR